jgi:hypothetical protein
MKYLYIFTTVHFSHKRVGGVEQLFEVITIKHIATYKLRFVTVILGIYVKLKNYSALDNGHVDTKT